MFSPEIFPRIAAEIPPTITAGTPRRDSSRHFSWNFYQISTRNSLNNSTENSTRIFSKMSIISWVWTQDSQIGKYTKRTLKFLYSLHCWSLAYIISTENIQQLQTVAFLINKFSIWVPLPPFFSRVLCHQTKHVLIKAARIDLFQQITQ